MCIRDRTVLILIFLLSAIPVPTVEAQVGAAAVNLECVSVDASGSVQVEVYPGATLTGQALCTVSNPNSYQEKIEIEVQSDGLVNSAPGSIDFPFLDSATISLTEKAKGNSSPFGARTVIREKSIPPFSVNFPPERSP